MNPILQFAAGRECMKVCDYATFINLLEMKFSKEELIAKDKDAKDGGRFNQAKKDLKKDLFKTQNIKSRLNFRQIEKK